MARDRTLLIAALCLALMSAFCRNAFGAPLQQELFTEAQRDYLKGDYLRAVENFKNARNMDPLNKTGLAAHLLLGQAYEMAGEYEKAIGVYGDIYSDYWNYRAFSSDNDDVIKALLTEGDLFRLRLKKPEEAMARYKKLISDFPSSDFASVARQSIIECYRDMGMEKELKKSLDELSGAARYSRSSAILKVAVPVAAALALLLTVLF